MAIVPTMDGIIIRKFELFSSTVRPGMNGISSSRNLMIAAEMRCFNEQILILKCHGLQCVPVYMNESLQ